jgi:hypothetical protein
MRSAQLDIDSRWLRAAVVSTAAALTTVLQTLQAMRSLNEPDRFVTPGFDFRVLVWWPIRGLLAGHDPYPRPVNPEYADATGAVVGPAPRPPSLLLLEGWLAVPSATTGFVLSVVLGCLLLWAGIVLMVWPSTTRQAALTAAMGSAVVLGGHADFMLGLGQTTGWAVLGLGLIIRWPERFAGAIGLSLVLVMPQFGVVLSLMLLALRQWRLVAQGWALMALMSVPGALLMVSAAGGVMPLFDSLMSSMSYVAGSGNALNRVDLGGVLAGSGSVEWMLPLALLGLFIVLLARVNPVLDEVLYLGMVSVLALSTYFMPYHVPLLLAVAVAAVLAPQTPPSVSIPAVILLVASLLSSFALLWAVGPDPSGLERGLWLALRYTVQLAPLVLSIAAGWETMRRAEARHLDVAGGSSSAPSDVLGSQARALSHLGSPRPKARQRHLG